MSKETEGRIRQRATSAVLQRALLSWQSLFTIGLTAGLYLFVQDPFVWWQPWFWLIGGAAAEAAWIAASLTDEEANREAVSKAFERQYDVGQIRNRVSRQRFKNAMEYRRSMYQLLRQHSGAMRVSLRQTVEDVDDWISHMYDLALHIDMFESNELVERDRRTVPQEISNTRKRIELEKDPVIREDLERKLAILEQQLANLEATTNSARRAEIQLESTLSSLGTIYAQMSQLGTKEVDSARAQRLRLEIQDEVAGLQDTIDAMDEVQSQRLYLR